METTEKLKFRLVSPVSNKSALSVNVEVIRRIFSGHQVDVECSNLAYGYGTVTVRILTASDSLHDRLTFKFGDTFMYMSHKHSAKWKIFYNKDVDMDKFHKKAAEIVSNLEEDAKRQSARRIGITKYSDMCDAAKDKLSIKEFYKSISTKYDTHSFTIEYWNRDLGYTAIICYEERNQDKPYVRLVITQSMCELSEFQSKTDNLAAISKHANMRVVEIVDSCK